MGNKKIRKIEKFVKKNLRTINNEGHGFQN